MRGIKYASGLTEFLLSLLHNMCIDRFTIHQSIKKCMVFAFIGICIHIYCCQFCFILKSKSKSKADIAYHHGVMSGVKKYNYNNII